MKKEKVSTKDKKQDKPKRAFEEFAIDQSILDDLDNLPEEVNNEEEQPQEVPLTDEMQVIDVEDKKQEIIDASSTEFINIVRDNIQQCAKEIKEISETMQKIEDQKNSESFWKKGENIKTISKNVNKMSEVQQKTLDLLVMFLGASGKMADDYDTIMKTIDELGEVNGGEVEVLDYLLKIKKMVKEIKSNDERLKAIMFDNERLKNRVETLETGYKDKVNSYEKNSKIMVSKINRLHGKTNGISLFTLIAYLLIVAIGVILYIKVF